MDKKSFDKQKSKLMKNVKITSEGINHCAIDLGIFDKLMDYSYLHPKRHQEIKGKQFVGEILKTTGAEISFQILPPHTEISFMHQHRQHEEIYVFLKGSGQFQVDESVFEVSEGSVIRISPNGKRTYRNNSGSPLIFMCIQCKAGSLENFFVEDGFRADGEILWNKQQ
jgi:mannose-6-phosphate isomerase-like protein (cupin superfamily)